ncbi:hypothetical protein CFC21_017036, partial [Triticum aestivum]
MPLHLLLLLLLLPSAAVAGKARQSSSFALDFFPGDGAIAQLALTGANATSAGDISMRSPRARVQYHKPIHLAPVATGFSTYFSFSLHPSPKSHAASIAFFLTPAAPSPAVNALAVVFAAADSSHIRVQIDLAGETAAQTAPRGIPKKLHSWIDYNATSATLQVRLSASRLPKPPRALLSHPLHLHSAPPPPQHQAHARRIRILPRQLQPLQLGLQGQPRASLPHALPATQSHRLIAHHAAATPPPPRSPGQPLPLGFAAVGGRVRRRLHIRRALRLVLHGEAPPGRAGGVPHAPVLLRHRLREDCAGRSQGPPCRCHRSCSQV